MVLLRCSLHDSSDVEALMLVTKVLGCSFPVHFYRKPSLEKRVLHLGCLFQASVSVMVVATVASGPLVGIAQFSTFLVSKWVA